MRAIAETGGTGLSYPWDGIREDIPEAVVLSGDTVQALGWFCLPGLSHWFVDNVWADLGRGAGCLRHLHAIKVEHAWKGDQTSAENSTSYAADSTATAYAVGPSTTTAASTCLYSSANGSGTGTYATYGAVLWSQTTPCTAGANWGEWFMPGFELNAGNSPGTLLAVTSNVNLMPELVISE
jgi:hypothetical protein